MLENVHPADGLRGLARARARNYELRTVSRKAVEELEAKGWSVAKELKTGVRLRRDKPPPVLLEDRVWTLLRKMGFDHLSGEGGAFLSVASDGAGTRNQLDAVAIDPETAVAAECKSAQRPGRRPELQAELSELAGFRRSFAQAIRNRYGAKRKRQVGMAMFTSNIVHSDGDRQRGREVGVVLFDDQDLDYYEKLTAHLGPAAKYQFLADLLPGKRIPGLAIRVPAIRTKMGGVNCYTFLASPEYLLKVSFVSHRSKGKASDVHTYQRMLSRSRLGKIRDYITDDGIFPTNIVLSIDTAHTKTNFERIRQSVDGEFDPDRGTLGWLDIRPAYKSAWIIDGQHRLFAYSGHKRAQKALLSVLAFEGLPPSTQAQLFIDINSKQKSVKQSLLQELYAELHWDAEDAQTRVRAIVSKAIQVLDVDGGSPFCGRIQLADGDKTKTRCISLTSLYSALTSNSSLYVAHQKHGQVQEYGPLWAVDNDATLKRSTRMLNRWFGTICAGAGEWWSLGAEEGGGLAMNDAVVALIRVAQSVIAHLDTGIRRLRDLDDEELCECLEPYALALGAYLGGLSLDERKGFRELRGVQGQNTRARRCQAALREEFPSFSPPGLDDFLQRERAQTNTRAMEIVDRIERTLHELVLGELRRAYKADGSQWWTMGVPLQIRLEASKRYEQENRARSGPEKHLDLIDYRQIALANWAIFEPLLGYGKKNQKKEKRTLWMSRLNERRKAIAHPSSGINLSLEELAELESYERWLRGQIAAAYAAEGAMDGIDKLPVMLEAPYGAEGDDEGDT